MKTPGFWNSRNFISTLLLPVSVLYDIASMLWRLRITPTVLPVPVICIGNLTAGGGGKTPVALAIGQLLKEKNIAAFFLSRGYGGTLSGPVLVDPGKHTAREVGDEPLLLAGILPTVIAKDRLSGARFAIAQGAKAIIMDDGFQNPSIVKTLALLVVDGQSVFGNGRLIPAGPLREPPESGFSRAHAVIVINRGGDLPPMPQNKPILLAKTQPLNADNLKGKKLLAFCGIARPQKFFDSLNNLGADIIERVSFADHYPYKDSDMAKLIARAAKHQAILVTTAKDAVRLSAPLRKQVTVVDMSLNFDNSAQLDALLNHVLKTP